MKLERLPEYLTIGITIVFGIFLALYLGLSAGAESNTSFQIIGGIIAVLVALILRANIWLLIPLFWPFAGKLVNIPGELPLRDLAIAYVFVVFLALKALKVVRAKICYNWLDWLLFVNLIYLFATFIRNPVGTESMGLDRVGGKTYFEVLFLLCGYWVIGHITIAANQAQKLPLLLILGDLIGGVINFMSFHLPTIGMAIGRVYSGVELSESALGSGGGSGPEREGYLVLPGLAGSKALFASYSPFTVINPLFFWRFLLFCFSLFLVLKSGFRGILISVGFFFVLSTFFRHGFWSVVRLSMVVAPLIALLVLSQGTFVDLPPMMQRALSFLPGDWNPEVVVEAERSLEWRHEIWSNVMSSGHKYINDWWFGDGFGITKVQLREALNSPNDTQENFAINGDYHSLPLSAIRTVGYVGFSLYCVLLLGTAVYAWHLIRRAKGTPFFGAALFLGVPAIISPPQELLLTGFFAPSYLGTIFGIAMMRMTSRSLEAYRLEQKEAAPEPVKALPELTGHRFQSDLSL